jgi:anti-anti-sigma regulatory factor
MKPESVKLRRRKSGTDNVSPMKTTKRKSKTVEKTLVPVAERVPAAKPVAVAPPVAPPVRVIAISSHCTIKDAAALKLDLIAMANESAEVTLDVGSIERIDTATMQLLCAFARDRAQRNQKVIWKGESPSWLDAVRLLGTATLLGFSPAAGA